MYPRRRDYPKSIKVGQTDYRIRFVRQDTLDRLAEGENTRGLCCSGSETIYLLIGLSAKERFETFVHETLHAVEFEYKIKIPHRLIYDLEAPLARLYFDALAG